MKCSTLNEIILLAKPFYEANKFTYKFLDDLRNTRPDKSFYRTKTAKKMWNFRADMNMKYLMEHCDTL